MSDYKQAQREAEYLSRRYLTYLPVPPPEKALTGVVARDGKKWFLGKNQYGNATGWRRFHETDD